MGYYTEYKLEVQNGGGIIDYQEELESEYDLCFNEPMKWYDHEKNMRDYAERLEALLWEIEAYLTFNPSPPQKETTAIRRSITKAVGTYKQDIYQKHHEWLERIQKESE